MKIKTLSLLLLPLALVANIALAEDFSCRDIVDEGSYQISSHFVQAPSMVGCGVGAVVGGVVGLPVAVVYYPLMKVTSREVDCGTCSSPVIDGAKFIGNVGHTIVGLPFFIVETLLWGGE